MTKNEGQTHFCAECEAKSKTIEELREQIGRLTAAVGISAPLSEMPGKDVVDMTDEELEAIIRGEPTKSEP